MDKLSSVGLFIDNVFLWLIVLMIYERIDITAEIDLFAMEKIFRKFPLKNYAIHYCILLP